MCLLKASDIIYSTFVKTIKTLSKLTFDPEIIFKCLCYQLSSLVINERIFTNCYSSKSRHSIKIWAAIAQTVLPCYTVTPCGLMLVIINKKQEVKIINW